MKLPNRSDPEFQHELLKAIAKHEDGFAIAEELRPEIEGAMKLSVPPADKQRWKNEISWTLIVMRRQKKWLQTPFFDYEKENGGPTPDDRKWILMNRKGLNPSQRVWQLTDAGRKKAVELGLDIPWKPPVELDLIAEVEDKRGSFDPKNDAEAKERVLRSIVLRRGQPKFRQDLLDTYKRCLISGCTAENALEAAHIQPFASGGTNNISNGLLLRADLHTLFDLDLIRIDPDDMTVFVTPPLLGSEYKDFQKKPLLLPKNADVNLDKEALKNRWAKKPGA